MRNPFAGPLSLMLLILSSQTITCANAADLNHGCSKNESWDVSMSMCMPLAGSQTPRTVISGRFNVFGVFSAVQGLRGVNQFAAPNMFMIDAGSTIGTRQFINLDLMGTTELWTYSQHGYPELLQVGEERSDGTAFVDAQHPHSSPIMGLTLSDTITIDQAKTLKLFLAPRGESTDGPIALMHRVSARDNPDAPLGHHVGQDVGHISSTVVGAQLNLGTWVVEASAFNGTEPEPTHVDLPIGPLNSEALRITYLLASQHRIMASIAQVDQTDPIYPGTTSATRLSASIYDHLLLGSGSLDHSFIVGSITRRPRPSTLNSFLDEGTWKHNTFDIWGRVEVLQRLASELEMPTASVMGDEKRWVSAFTVGYTHWSAWHPKLGFGVGTSLTMDVLPSEWVTAYGRRTPLTARLIFQLRGSGQWNH